MNTLSELNLQSLGSLIPKDTYQAHAAESVAAIRQKYPQGDPLSLRLNYIQRKYPGAVCRIPYSLRFSSYSIVIQWPIEAKSRLQVNSILENQDMVLPDGREVVISIEETAETVVVPSTKNVLGERLTGAGDYDNFGIDKSDYGELPRLLDPQNAHTGIQSTRSPRRSRHGTCGSQSRTVGWLWK